MKQKITEKLKGIKGKVRIITYKAGTKEILRTSRWSKNLVVLGVNTGRNLIAQRLAGINTYSLNITHGDIGTGSTAPANSDTQLTTPSVRTVLSSYDVNNNVAQLQFFFADSILANGTYREFGTFVDGTSTISTGKMFNHALFSSPYVKASGEDTIVEVDFTIN